MSILPASVFAGGLYVSFSQGRATNVDIANTGGTPIGTSVSLMLGVDLYQYLSAEIGYSSLLTKTGYSSATGSHNVTLNGQEIAAVGKWPINEQITLLARVGWAFMSFLDKTDQISGSTETIGYPFGSPSGVVWGPGISYKINEKFDVRAGYNVYILTGSTSGAYSSTNNGTQSSGQLGGSGDLITTNAYLSAVLHF